MKLPLSLTFLLALSASFANNPADFQKTITETEYANSYDVPSTSAFPFTGKVSSKGVRLRTSPDLDSHVLRELNQDDYLLIVGEVENFYAVQPNPNTPLYIFRSFVLDGVVEAQNVNVRMGPSLSDPIVARLQSGTTVHGKVCSSNAKWLEISPPENVHFYLAKDYVEKVGGPQIIHNLHAQKESLDELFVSLHIAINEQKQKNYEEMQIQEIERIIEKVRSEYPSFKSDIRKAEELFHGLKEHFLAKKVAFLEKQMHADVITVNDEPSNKASSTSSENRSEKLEAVAAQAESPARIETTPEAVLKWKNIEYARYLGWTEEHPEQPISDFYNEERLTATRLTGEIAAFECNLSARPGDFLLKQKGLAVAYLYSTLVDLSDLEGKEVSLVVVPRPNNDFAFPTYFVIAAE